MCRRYLCWGLMGVVGWWAAAVPAFGQWRSAEQGTLLGAAAGGGAGAAIGKKTGNPILGAVIGTLGGGIVGNRIGDEIDQRRAAEAYYYQQQQQQQQYQQYQQMSAVSLDQVVQLTRNGLSDDLILSHIEQNGFQQTISANDLITLKQQGVSDRVIQALQRSSGQGRPSGLAQHPPAFRPQRPLTVIEEVHVVPAWSGPVYYYPPP